MKKLLSLALVVCFVSLLVACKQAPDEPEIKGWSSFNYLTAAEQEALISQPAEWGSEWFSMPGVMGSSVTSRYKMIVGRNATQSWISMVYDYSNLPEEQLNTMKTSFEEHPTPGDEYIWNGKILTIKTVSDNPSGNSNFASLMKDSEISSDRKTLRFTDEFGEYIYYYRLS